MTGDESIRPEDTEQAGPPSRPGLSRGVSEGYLEPSQAARVASSSDEGKFT